jgi:hypothetical protein
LCRAVLSRGQAFASAGIAVLRPSGATDLPAANVVKKAACSRATGPLMREPVVQQIVTGNEILNILARVSQDSVGSGVSSMALP